MLAWHSAFTLGELSSSVQTDDSSLVVDSVGPFARSPQSLRWSLPPTAGIMIKA